MPAAHEDDVVVLFRQAVEEELRKLQSGQTQARTSIFDGDAPIEEAVRRLAQRHDELEQEVALLRTILLRLVSDPVDSSGESAT